MVHKVVLGLHWSFFSTSKHASVLTKWVQSFVVE